MRGDSALKKRFHVHDEISFMQRNFYNATQHAVLSYPVYSRPYRIELVEISGTAVVIWKLVARVSYTGSWKCGHKIFTNTLRDSSKFHLHCVLVTELMVQFPSGRLPANKKRWKKMK